MLSGGPRNLLASNRFVGVIVVGEYERDRDPRHRGNRDPCDRMAQVADPHGPRQRGQAEPAEVVPGDTEQDVRAAPHLEQVGVRSDDQDDRGGAKRDAGFQCGAPRSPPPRGGSGCASSRAGTAAASRPGVGRGRVRGAPTSSRRTASCRRGRRSLPRGRCRRRRGSGPRRTTPAGPRCSVAAAAASARAAW